MNVLATEREVVGSVHTWVVGGGIARHTQSVGGVEVSCTVGEGLEENKKSNKS